jgi:hypothetical protein
MRWITRFFDRGIARKNDRFRYDFDMLCENVYWGNNLTQASAMIHGQIMEAIMYTDDFDDDTRSSGVVLKERNSAVHWAIVINPGYNTLHLCVHMVTLASDNVIPFQAA